MIATRLSPVVLGLLCITVTIACGCETVQTRHDVEVNWLADQSSVKSIGVTEFTWNQPGAESPPPGWSFGHMGDDIGLGVSNTIAAALLKLNRYDVQERGQLAKVAEDQRLQLSDLVAKGDRQRTGVDGVVVGSIELANVMMNGSCMQVEIAFQCRCVSAKTGSVLWSMGGSKSISWAGRLGPWVGELAEELVTELKDRLAHPPPSAK